MLQYLAAGIISGTNLKKDLEDAEKCERIIKTFNNKLDFVEDVKELYKSSFLKYSLELSKENTASFDINKSIQKSFLRLDQDLAEEAINYTNPKTLAVALSGSCAVVAYIEKSVVTIASVGDCVAVLGSLSDSGQWVAKKLSNEHNADNPNEIRRIFNEHPFAEKDHVIKSERLLGQLAPFRAIGDFKFKWKKKQLLKLGITPPPTYRTPPYLSALPEVNQQKLTTRDKFLVLASDGLWDIISAFQAVQLIGEHMSGKAFLQPLKLPRRNIKLGNIENILDKRKEGLVKKPIDRNAATHLLRYALGATDLGNIEHEKLSHMLSLPQEIVRLFRDDITITIIYFDPNYLRNLPR